MIRVVFRSLAGAEAQIDQPAAFATSVTVRTLWDAVAGAFVDDVAADAAGAAAAGLDAARLILVVPGAPPAACPDLTPFLDTVRRLLRRLSGSTLAFGLP